MTTKNITGLDAALKHLLAAADEVRKREHEIDAELKALDTQEGNLLVGAGALLQRIHDEKSDLSEEASQIEAILGRLKRAERPEQPPAPTPEPEVTTPPVVPITVPPEPVKEPEVVLQPPAPTPEPQQIVLNQEPVKRPNPINPRNWGWVQWVLALVFGLAIGLPLGFNYYEAASGGHIHGGWLNLFAVVFVVAVFDALFFLGGLIGSLFDRKSRS